MDSPVAGITFPITITEVYRDFMDAVNVKNIEFLGARSGIGARSVNGVAQLNSKAQSFERSAFEKVAIPAL